MDVHVVLGKRGLIVYLVSTSLVPFGRPLDDVISYDLPEIYGILYK